MFYYIFEKIFVILRNLFNYIKGIKVALKVVKFAFI